MVQFESQFEDERFIIKIFNDIKIYCEASCIYIPRLLVTNDHQFYKVVMKSKEFNRIIWTTIGRHLEVILCQVLLAQEIIDGMP